MSASLSAWQIAVLAAYAAGMAGGQLLFKSAALRMPAQGTFAERLLALAYNGYFIAALAAYLGLSLVWVWLLRFTPLSRAYLFVALSFALVPLARRWRSTSRSRDDSCSARPHRVRADIGRELSSRSSGGAFCAPACKASPMAMARASPVIASVCVRSLRCRLSSTKRLITTQI
jgi:hypothetical protein